MEQIPKIVGQRLRATATVGPHPDAGLLTAFVEKSLSGHERGQVLEHLAQCAGCREVVSLSLPEMVAGQAVLLKPLRGWWLSWPALRWVAVAACIVVVGALFTDRHLQHEKLATLAPGNQTLSLALKNDSDLKTSGARSENDRLAAKLEAPPVAPPKRDLNRPREAVKAPSPAQSAGAIAARAAATESMANAKVYSYSAPAQGVQVPSASQSVEVATAPSPTMPTRSEPAKNHASADGSFSSNMEPRSTNETVEVAAEAPAVEIAEATPGKAKEAKKSLQKESQAQMASNMTARSGAADQLAVQAKNYSAMVGLAPPDRWTISAGGAVERSLDAGKTWQPVPVADHVIFRAVSALGTEVWAGGTGGALYHSSDSGQTWVQVKPNAGGTPLTADIISLQFLDAQQGKLMTADHQTWITTDAGKSWQKQ